MTSTPKDPTDGAVEEIVDKMVYAFEARWTGKNLTSNNNIIECLGDGEDFYYHLSFDGRKWLQNEFRTTLTEQAIQQAAFVDELLQMLYGNDSCSCFDHAHRLAEEKGYLPPQPKD